MHETYDLEIQRTDRNHVGLAATGPRLGIVGGGQLARMTAQAAAQLGCEVVVLERTRFSPATRFAAHARVGDWNTAEALLELAAQVDVVTLENEFVDAGHLETLETHGYQVLPGARTLRLVQDKYLQKQTLANAGLPVPRMRAVNHFQELAEAVREFGLPLLLKARRNAYDGKGNATLRSQSDLEPAWKQLGGPLGQALFAEEFCDFAAELAVIVTRGRSGETAVYPVTQTIQRNHVCHVVRAPAPVSAQIARQASELACRAVKTVDAVGSFGVEMFLGRQGDLMLNELAPRVHNSGHYTIEACACSQFENHVRAVLGWPLGSTQLVAPAAVMVNLLGDARAPGRPLGLNRALTVPGARVHLYGKVMSGLGRKMGHVTALGQTIEEAEKTATRCAAEIRFGNQS